MKNLILRTILAGGGAGLLGLGTLGATPVLAAATPTPAGTTQQAPAAKPKADQRQDRRQIRLAVFEAEADALGMKPEELRKALKSGQTVAQIAASKGLTKDQVADRLMANLKPALAKLVAEHKITQAQADRTIDHIQKIGGVPGWDGFHHKKK